MSLDQTDADSVSLNLTAAEVLGKKARPESP